VPLVILRVISVLALILLLWNPASSRTLPSGDQPIVLLDASLSLDGPPFRAALDSARAHAGRGALVWRFGTSVTAFDTTPPKDGATRLGPALEAAAGRAGEVVVVTDGRIDDAAAIPPDLLRRPRVIVVPHSEAFDAYIANVDGRRHLTRSDTVRLTVSYGAGGKRETGNGKRETGNGKRAILAVRVGDKELASQRVSLPDSGTVTSEITFPVSRFPSPGWQVLEVRLDGVADAESRDDSRLFAVEVSLEPAAVVFASPPDWEARFLTRTLADVARMPVKMFVETEPGRWRDAATLAPVSNADLARAAVNARLVAATGDPARARAFLTGRAARLLWSTNGQAGDWYVERPPSSPFSSALSGVLWDSLPPATAVTIANPQDSTGDVALSARLARRGTARPIVRLQQRENGREAIIGAAGLWRWSFRGGASEEAYRSLVAALVDWLLGEEGRGTRERVVLESPEVPNGIPVKWRWNSSEDPHPVAITLRSPDSTRTDTLRFDDTGRAELLLAPGIYRYTLSGGPEQGVVAVETYSDEWLPRAPTLHAQIGEATVRVGSTALRDRWWLFVLAIVALATEWALRRRQGLA
jgi:hypothetical protein